jgi:hypothetical protein
MCLFGHSLKNLRPSQWRRSGFADGPTVPRQPNYSSLGLGGLDMFSGSPADFGKFMVDETEKQAKVIQATNVRPD